MRCSPGSSAPCLAHLVICRRQTAVSSLRATDELRPLHFIRAQQGTHTDGCTRTFSASATAASALTIWREPLRLLCRRASWKGRVGCALSCRDGFDDRAAAVTGADCFCASIMVAACSHKNDCTACQVQKQRKCRTIVCPFQDTVARAACSGDMKMKCPWWVMKAGQGDYRGDTMQSP